MGKAQSSLNGCQNHREYAPVKLGWSESKVIPESSQTLETKVKGWRAFLCRRERIYTQN